MKWGNENLKSLDCVFRPIDAWVDDCVQRAAVVRMDEEVKAEEIEDEAADDNRGINAIGGSLMWDNEFRSSWKT